MIQFFALSVVVFYLANNAQAQLDGEKGCASEEITRESLNKPCEMNSGYVDVELDKALTFTCGEWKSLQEVSSQKKPKIAFKQADKEKKYTLLMLDPNAPNHGDKYWLHWLVTGIQGEDLAAGNLDNAKTVTDYFPPKPPAGSGDHHYQFFLFTESSSPVSVSSPSRARFDAVNFVRLHNLCGPAAATQFITGH
uniref:Venom protein n=1 Tax=Scolopendra viridis TaxID=118503 RepID=A0A4D5R952_SCOVI